MKKASVNMKKQTEMNESINTLQNKIENSLSKIKNLSFEEKKQKVADIKDMINYYSKITSEVENRRIKLVETAWQNILIILASLTIITSLDILLMYKALIILLIGLFLIPQILKIREFNEQCRFRFPFLMIPGFSNQWKWFYYGNKYILQISENPFKRDLENDKINYLKGLDQFIGNYTDEQIDSELKEGMLQLYLLQVHNFYKNRWYLRLQDIEKDWLPKLLVLASILMILFIIIRITFPNLFIPEFIITG